MLLYHNENWRAVLVPYLLKAFWDPALWLVAFISSSIALSISYVCGQVDDDAAANGESNFFALQSMSDCKFWLNSPSESFYMLIHLLVLSLVFRVQVAWTRYWDGCGAVQQMWSRWKDSCTLILSFLDTSLEQPNLDKLEREFFLSYRQTMAHWFSLLSACACNRLLKGDIVMMRRHARSGGKSICTREEFKLWEIARGTGGTF